MKRFIFLSITAVFVLFVAFLYGWNKFNQPKIQPQPLPVFSTSVNPSLKRSVAPGEAITVDVKISESDGTPGTPQEGFRMQMYIETLDNKKIQGAFDTLFDPDESWKGVVKAPSQEGTYWVLTTASCVESHESECGKRYGKGRTVDRRISFVVTTQKIPIDISVSFPQRDEVIPASFSIFQATGYVNGNGWTSFEGHTGTVKLVEIINGNIGETLDSAVLRATSDWGEFPIFFEADLSVFAKGYREVAEQGMLIFENENPSGLPENARQFQLPIRLRRVTDEVIPSSITVLAPNGGERCEIGKQCLISWTSPLFIPQVGGISVDLIRRDKDPNTNTYMHTYVSNILTSSNPKMEFLRWTVPFDIEPSNEYKIEVSPLVPGGRFGFDASDDYFSIVSSTSP